jgi:tetratricopeptide (TPR) repeat protein
MEPDHPITQAQSLDLLMQEAISLQKVGELEKAIALYQSLIHQLPHHPQILFWYGTAEQQSKNYLHSIELLLQCLNHDPCHISAHNNLGAAYQALGQTEKAKEAFSCAIELNPQYLSAYLNRARLHYTLEQYPKSLEDFSTALTLEEMPQLYFERGNVFHQMGNLAQALSDYSFAIEKTTNFAQAYCNRGVVHYDLGQFNQALEDYQQALILDPHLIEAHINQGNLLGDQGRTEQALLCYDQALHLDPQNLDALSNRAVTLQECGHLDKAMQDYERAIEINPNHSKAQWNRALCLLLQGDFTRGWPAYEWGWENGMRGAIRHFSKSLWLGKEDLKNTTLFLYTEQGMGDAIQFIRYIPLLQARGAKIILEAPASLISLFSSIANDIELIEQGSAVPPFDLHCPLLSLPLACQTQLDTIPSKTPYLFSDPIQSGYWKNCLEKTDQLRVGIAWSGGGQYRQDHRRSIALSLFKPLLQLPIQWHSLQTEYREADKAVLEQLPMIYQHQERLNHFSDTAALISQLDLVITVDTAVAHLAGALGKPVWILLPHAPDFRWLMNRTDSPWYPSAKLFRQENMLDWQRSINKVKESLELFIDQDNLNSLPTSSCVRV